MDINWNAVFSGFIVAVVLGLAASLVGVSETSVWLFTIPGLVGGFVAGYMVSGVGDGAVHGGLATVIGALLTLAFLTVFGVLFIGIIPAIGGATIALLVLFFQAIPGAIAGAVGGWAKDRRAPQAAAGSETASR
ncbi:DUF5518 domain-containing protein [Haloarchaeobius baliensis]|uniref:DUF5518 domain-containing protein n=1 Tax=Haloarchaeobius baliensis TaxID=1670458 RepID=UPI003F882852